MRTVGNVAVVVLLCGCSMSSDSKLAEQAVPEFHRMLDAAQFDAIYNASAGDLKRVTTRSDFVDLLEAVHRRLGVAASSDQQTWTVNYNTSGTYVTLTYHTKYAEGDATEQFVYHLESGQALLAGYHISSNALILK
jgi:Protein of unknown function (DUF4019)